MSDAAPDPTTAPGWVSEELRAEFPDLRLHVIAVNACAGRSPRALKQRLHDLSDRFRGGQALTLRQEPVPWAYRVFFRHIGLDPDATRTPLEQAALDRLLHGSFRSSNLLDDALLVALIETGIPVWALDDRHTTGRLGIRTAQAGEHLGEGDAALPLPSGRLVVVDDAGPVGVLFGPLAPGRGCTKSTDRMLLFAIQVAGVPTIHVEEALWSVVESLGGSAD